MKNTPPKILVKTWYQLLKQNSDQEAKQRAENMILTVFGSMEKFAKYVERNNL